MFFGHMSFDPKMEAQRLARILSDPRKAFQQQKVFNDYGAFVATVLAVRDAYAAIDAPVPGIPDHVRNVSASAQPKFWIIKGEQAIPTLGFTHNTREAWAPNLTNVGEPLRLAIDECGDTWRLGFGPNAKLAIANSRSASMETRCRAIRRRLTTPSAVLRELGV